MKEIFVFGSNLAGRHGKGAALCALREHGAIYGKGWGPQGSSYAIPTKDEKLKVLPLYTIKECIDEFKDHVEDMLGYGYIFNITAIGCGLAGYKPEQIAPLFAWCLQDEFKDCCKLSKEFLNVLEKE